MFRRILRRAWPNTEKPMSLAWRVFFAIVGLGGLLVGVGFGGDASVFMAVMGAFMILGAALGEWG